MNFPDEISPFPFVVDLCSHIGTSIGARNDILWPRFHHVGLPSDTRPPPPHPSPGVVIEHDHQTFPQNSDIVAVNEILKFNHFYGDFRALDFWNWITVKLDHWQLTWTASSARWYLRKMVPWLGQWRRGGQMAWGNWLSRSPTAVFQFQGSPCTARDVINLDSASSSSSTGTNFVS